MKTKNAGFTLVEIMIVVAIIGLLAAIAIPNFVKARYTAQTTTCIANLSQISSAVQQWALEKNKKGSDAVEVIDISGDTTKQLKGLINGSITCNAGGTYAVTTVDSLPTCTVGGTHVINQ